MNKLIILVGDTGSGKSHLVNLVSDNYRDDFDVIKKYTNRQKRAGEENAIEIKSGCSEEELQGFEYSYIGKCNKIYVFSKSQIDTALQMRKNPIVIVANEEMLLRLCNDYRNRACPIYLQRDTIDADFIRELKKEGRTDEQINERLAGRHEILDLYIKHKKLFGDNFIRDKNAEGINTLLNYGYTILRSGTARSIMGAGLHPAIGIFHKNKYNSMRLADDLMEPFRPIVDYFVYKFSEKEKYELTPDVKENLVNILYLDLDGPRGRSPVINRMQSLAYTYAYSLETLKKNLDLPILKISDLCETN